MPKTPLMKRCVLLVLTVLLIASTTGHAPAGLSRKPDPAMVEARQRFFGAENVDPRTGAVRDDRVILSWFSVASYAASFNGHVVLLDGWIARGTHSGYVPTSPEEVAALDPEYIFIGHGDFDHAADVGEIAKRSGAMVVGSPEHCDLVNEQAGEKVRCKAIVPEAAPPGLVWQGPDFLPGVDISAVVHVHSSLERPEPNPERSPCPPIWNPQDTIEHPPTAEDAAHQLRHLRDARGANILYQFRVGRFSLAHHDTVGKIDDNPVVVKALESLPQTDVDFGAVLAFGQVTNCLRSLGLYLRALQPKVYAATHHDNFTLIGTNARQLEPHVRAELKRLPKKLRPALLYTYDPDDYLNPDPFTFDPTEARWR